jgi:hypothetical protein
MITITPYHIVSESVKTSDSDQRVSIGGVMVVGGEAATIVALRSHLRIERKTYIQLKNLYKKVSRSRSGYGENVKDMIRVKLRNTKRRISAAESELSRIRSKLIKNKS